MRRLEKSNFHDFSDQKLIEILLKPKSNGKRAISFMVATNETVRQIEIRPPQMHFCLFDFTKSQTWMFHQAQIIGHDSNMVLCQWTVGHKFDHTKTVKFSEWIFKGSPQEWI
jgi:hypothetical protein